MQPLPFQNRRLPVVVSCYGLIDQACSTFILLLFSDHEYTLTAIFSDGRDILKQIG